MNTPPLGDTLARLRIGVEPFGHTEAGVAVERYTLTNRQSVRVQFLSYGGIVTAIHCPDRSGKMENIVLGFPTLRDYEPATVYFGALIGRYANRIAGGRFVLEGQEYRLAINNPPNTLHGGAKGFDRQVWEVEPREAQGQAVLRYTSADGEEGYPGRLQVTVTYTLTEANEFVIRYQASTDKTTVLNLTHHGYFNLGGAMADIGDQIMMVNADAYTPVNAELIPLGEIAPVADTPFDFRTPTPIGARLHEPHPQLRVAKGGYDHNWVLTKTGDANKPQLAARVLDPASGRVLECFTTEPGVQIFTRVFGLARRHDSFTLETQHFPDSPNQPAFPSTVLKPGENFDSTTIFRFAVG
jgi:aldose 1-epimerase